MVAPRKKNKSTDRQTIQRSSPADGHRRRGGSYSQYTSQPGGGLPRKRPFPPPDPTKPLRFNAAAPRTAIAVAATRSSPADGHCRRGDTKQPRGRPSPSRQHEAAPRTAIAVAATQSSPADGHRRRGGRLPIPPTNSMDHLRRCTPSFSRQSYRACGDRPETARRRGLVTSFPSRRAYSTCPGGRDKICASGERMAMHFQGWIYSVPRVEILQLRWDGEPIQTDNSTTKGGR